MFSQTNKMLAGLLLATIAVCSLSTTQAADFSDCANGSGSGEFSEVEVSNCADDDASCVLKRNSNATISITFQTRYDLADLKAVVHGIILGMEVPFVLPNNDGCKDSGIECPLKKNTSYRYSTTLPVLKQYPKVSVQVKWELVSAGSQVICVLIPAKIQ